MAELLSYLCAALAAFGNALANVMQRRASLESSPETPFGPKLMLGLIRNPTWVVGFLAMVGSFVLQAVALGLGQLSAVEPIITLEVPLTLLVAARVFGARLGRQEWGSILLMTGGMIALVGALDPRPTEEPSAGPLTFAVAGGATAATIALLILIGRGLPAIAKTACLGAAAGTSFGLTATLIKEVINRLDHRGLLGLLLGWPTFAAIGFGIFGVLFMQWALHSGPLVAAQPGFTLMDPLVSILWGVLVYQENTRTGPWLGLATAGGLAVGAGVAVLARSPLFTSTTVGASATGEASGNPIY